MPGLLRSALVVALAATLAWTPARATSERTAAATAPDPIAVLADARSSSMASSMSGPGNRRRSSASSSSASRPRGWRPATPPKLGSRFDSDALYVAVRAFDTEPDSIVGILTRRDQQSPSDWVKVIVDSYFDHRSAYEFAVNPVGVKSDRYYYNDGRATTAGMRCGTSRSQAIRDGWRAEFRIPFSQLRFNNTDGGPVGFAVVRRGRPPQRNDTWPLLSRNANGFVSQFAELRGMSIGGSPKRLELMPYTRRQRSTRSRSSGNPLSTRPTRRRPWAWT